jgi:alkaline phosphatase D
VCIPRPVERSDRADGGPLVYRAKYRATLWRKGEKPQLKGQILEGDPKFSI